jgi:hypothetical protein
MTPERDSVEKPDAYRTDDGVYLRTYYLTMGQLAAESSIGVRQLERLLELRLVPAASYTVSNDFILSSCVFGDLGPCEAEPGRYFHAKSTVWVGLACAALEAQGPVGAYELIKSRFRRNFARALATLDRRVFRLSDCFAEDGSPQEYALSARLDDAWESHSLGIFNLCVANPSSEYLIAEKEVLQEALQYHWQQATRDKFPQSQAAGIESLVQRYAAACMPFAPSEYARSSRRRLVDEMTLRLP